MTARQRVDGDADDGDEQEGDRSRRSRCRSSPRFRPLPRWCCCCCTGGSVWPRSDDGDAAFAADDALADGDSAGFDGCACVC